MTPDDSAGTGRIVVGIDGSPASLDAFRWAARQCELTQATLDVVMTWDWPPSYSWAAPIPSDFDPAADVRKAIDAAVAAVRAEHPGVDYHPLVLQGHPAPLLVEASAGADLLVVGSRGHGEFVGMLIGSVSEHLATNAHCPVLIHRPSS